MLSFLTPALSLLLLSQSQRADGVDLSKLECSYWLHASLGQRTLRNYWAPNGPAEPPPTQDEIRNAARLLTGRYAANRLYLMYHNEIALDDAERAFTAWRRACPPEVDIVPTLVLRMYDKAQSRVFTPRELQRFRDFCQARINPREIGVYDVYPDRKQEDDLALLAERFPHGLVRVGIQPTESIDPRCCRVVQDTWSGMCHGKTNEDWLSPGFGAETIAGWIKLRVDASAPVSWDLIVVAWDYAPTRRGEFPGYDDADKNMPLPAGRNRLAVRHTLDQLPASRLAGFSSDLFILQANSRAAAHDGDKHSFYMTLREGRAYDGYYRLPFDEVTAIYRDLKKGLLPPQSQPTTRPLKPS